MIAATLTASAAAAIHWDAIIVGAGPAGSATAIRLTRNGLRVLLIDRGSMPRPKVCGCCLSPQAMAELGSLLGGYDSEPRPIPLRLVRILARDGDARIPMQGGGTLSREALDPLLVRRALDAGADWLPRCSVRDCEDLDGTVHLLVRCDDGSLEAPRENLAPAVPAMLHGELCILATGLADHVRIRSAATSPPVPQRRQFSASRIGLGATLAAEEGRLPAGELVMAVGRAGYVGLVRLEDGRIDIAAAIDAAAVAAAGSSARALADLVADACIAAPGLVFRRPLLAAAVRATRPLTHASPLVAGDGSRIFRVGDAAGYIEPFTGEGMGWALSSARILAESLTRGGSVGRGTGQAASEYRVAYARAFAAHHARCRAVARAVRHPLLVAGAVRAAALSPRIAARLLPWVVGGRSAAAPISTSETSS